MYKKPFLSRYEFIMQNSLINSDFTVRTKAPGESSDDDEYHLSGTMFTEATETSDNDEYVAESTSRRRSIGDDDECYSFGTVITRAVEDSDPDFFMVFEETK